MLRRNQSLQPVVKGEKPDSVPKSPCPGRKGTGNPLHIPWQKCWRLPASVAWHCGARGSPARLHCAASTPHRLLFSLSLAAPASSLFTPSVWWLWESSRRPGAPPAFTGTPPSGQRGEGGREGTGKFWGARRLGCLAPEGHNWKQSDGGHRLSQPLLQFSGVTERFKARYQFSVNNN